MVNIIEEEMLYQQDVQQRPLEEGSYWWGILGFFIPLAGLILFLVWRTSYPKSSKGAGIGALAAVIIRLLVWTIILFIGVMTSYM